MVYKRSKLKNGIEVVSSYLPESTSASVFVIIKSGSAAEKIPGLAHFIEHVVFKGTSKRPTAFLINQEIEQVGGFLNAATSQEFTEFYAKIPYEYAEKGFEVLSDILQNSTFDSQELEKEKDVVVEEINMYSDMPVRNVSDSFYSLVWRENPLGRAILGTESTVRSITRGDVIETIKNWYCGDNMVISVAGNISPDKVQEFAQKYFEVFPSVSKRIKEARIDGLSWYDEGKVVEKFESDVMLIRKENKNVKQMHFCLGFEALSNDSETLPALEVGSALLAEGSSSYLWQKIREEMGAAYYLDAEIDAFKHTGIWYIHAGVDEDKVFDVLNECNNGLKLIKDKRFSTDELNRAKEYIKGDFKMNLEGSEEYARYAGHEIVEKGYVSGVDEESVKIDRVTLDDIANAFNGITSGKLFFNALTKQTTLTTLREILE